MRYSLLILLIFTLGVSVKASHIIGGNFEITQIGTNTFRVKLVIFKDCSPGTASLGSMQISAFDISSGSRVTNLLMQLPAGDTLTLGDECYSPPSLCIEEYTYLDSITLPDNPGGYTISAQVCCRNYAIDNLINPGGTGMTWVAEIPDPAIGNSTPKLGRYPSKGFLCLDDLRTLDLGATDPDGDSLYYQMVTPYNSGSGTGGNSPPSFPPYNPVNWESGYSASNAIPGNPSLKIDPETGVLECNASQLGLFVFAYSVSEYRNGVKIGEVRRDMQLQVLACENNRLPEFLAPKQLTFQTAAKEETCFQVYVVDSNALDSIYLISDFEVSPQNDQITPPSSLNIGGFEAVQGAICYTPNCIDVSLVKKMNIQLQAVSYNCKYTDTITETVVINLQAISPDVEDLFPNVFTPNEDGVNDNFELSEPLSIPCLSDFEIRIFNRWGTLVYEHQGSDFSWDGNYQSRQTTEGVYYFIINGSYTDKVFSYKNFLTLMR